MITTVCVSYSSLRRQVMQLIQLVSFVMWEPKENEVVVLVYRGQLFGLVLAKAHKSVYIGGYIISKYAEISKTTKQCWDLIQMRMLKDSNCKVCSTCYKRNCKL